MSDNSTRWLVITAGTRSRREVEAYLYAHTTIVAVNSDGFGDVYVAGVADLRENPDAEYLAHYQADRIASSGSMRAVVSETLPEARALALAELARLEEVAS